MKKSYVKPQIIDSRKRVGGVLPIPGLVGFVAGAAAVKAVNAMMGDKIEGREKSLQVREALLSGI